MTVVPCFGRSLVRSFIRSFNNDDDDDDDDDDDTTTQQHDNTTARQHDARFACMDGWKRARNRHESNDEANILVVAVLGRSR